jgi:hypothetical protein
MIQTSTDVQMSSAPTCDNAFLTVKNISFFFKKCYRTHTLLSDLLKIIIFWHSGIFMGIRRPQLDARHASKMTCFIFTGLQLSLNLHMTVTGDVPAVGPT